MQKTIGALLRVLRQEKQLTQANVATTMDVEVAYISNVENGHRNVSIKVIDDYLIAIGATKADILRIDKLPPSL